MFSFALLYEFPMTFNPPPPSYLLRFFSFLPNFVNFSFEVSFVMLGRRFLLALIFIRDLDTMLARNGCEFNSPLTGNQPPVASLMAWMAVDGHLTATLFPVAMALLCCSVSRCFLLVGFQGNFFVPSSVAYMVSLLSWFFFFFFSKYSVT